MGSFQTNGADSVGGIDELLSRQKVGVFVPDGLNPLQALERTTHWAFASHQDDIEIFALHGVLDCENSLDKWFGGVVVTDSPSTARGRFSHLTPEEMVRERRVEQTNAASNGNYSLVIQLGYHKNEVMTTNKLNVKRDLAAVLLASNPQVVYIHTPTNQHDTELATYLRSVQALRELPPEKAPRKVYGCEVRRDLDIIGNGGIVPLELYDPCNLGTALIGCFHTQNVRRDYLAATLGLRMANTVFHSKGDLGAPPITMAIDLTELIRDRTIGPFKYVLDAQASTITKLEERYKRFS